MRKGVAVAALALALLLAGCRAKTRTDGQQRAAPTAAPSPNAPSADQAAARAPSTPATAPDGTPNALAASKQWGAVTAAPELVRRALGPACEVRRIEPRFAGFANTEAAARVNRQLSTELDALQQALFSDAPCDGASADVPHRFEASYGLGAERAGHVALELHASAYSGGAHPNNLSRCFVLALADGHLLSLGKLLTTSARMQLGKEVTRRLAKQQGVAELTEAGFFTDHLVVKDDHGLCLTENGIRVQFQPYEVAPYALGFPAAELTVHEARSFFGRGSAVGLF